MVCQTLYYKIEKNIIILYILFLIFRFLLFFLPTSAFRLEEKTNTNTNNNIFKKQKFIPFLKEYLFLTLMKLIVIHIEIIIIMNGW
jgi:hypothetical protein